jgi:fluoride exporter
LKNIFYAAFGSALGGAFRYWISGQIHTYTSIIFPFGTLAVNVIGSFLLGLVLFYLDIKELIGPELKILLTVGFCGGLTTFSTFSYETFALIQNNEIMQALLNVALNIFFTLAAVAAAYYFSRFIAGA